MFLPTKEFSTFCDLSEMQLPCLSHCNLIDRVLANEASWKKIRSNYRLPCWTRHSIGQCPNRHLASPRHRRRPSKRKRRSNPNGVYSPTNRSTTRNRHRTGSTPTHFYSQMASRSYRTAALVSDDRNTISLSTRRRWARIRLAIHDGRYCPNVWLFESYSPCCSPSNNEPTRTLDCSEVQYPP